MIEINRSNLGYILFWICAYYHFDKINSLECIHCSRFKARKFIPNINSSYLDEFNHILKNNGILI